MTKWQSLGLGRFRAKNNYKILYRAYEKGEGITIYGLFDLQKTHLARFLLVLRDFA